MSLPPLLFSSSLPAGQNNPSANATATPAPAAAPPTATSVGATSPASTSVGATAASPSATGKTATALGTAPGSATAPDGKMNFQQFLQAAQARGAGEGKNGMVMPEVNAGALLSNPLENPLTDASFVGESTPVVDGEMDMETLLATAQVAEGTTLDWRGLAVSHSLQNALPTAELAPSDGAEQSLTLEEIVGLLTRGNVLPSAENVPATDPSEPAEFDEFLDPATPVGIFGLQTPWTAPPADVAALVPAEPVRVSDSAILLGSSEEAMSIDVAADAEDDIGMLSGLRKNLNVEVAASTEKVSLFTRAFDAAGLGDEGGISVQSEGTPVSTSPVSQAAARSFIAADATAAGRMTLPVQVSFGHAQWSEALAERTAWLASQHIHSADLQLDPPELGPLQVKITVQNDQAVVNFVSANPLVRDALDQSLVKLREMFQEQGLQLVDAGVSDQRQQNHEQTDSLAEQPVGATAGSDSDGSSASLEPVTTPVVTRYGVDDFV